jgi:ornithine cyclodeaminase/alanine dehydrogenase-like protein (mu-crystallin family)
VSTNASPPAVRLLDRTDVRSVLSWPAVIDVVRAAFRAAASDRALPPAAAQVQIPRGSLHLKAGGLVDPTLISVKANLRPDGARAFGVVLVFDADRGALRAVLDSADITAWRTAAAAVVAAQALGARDGCSVAVLGAGPVGSGVIAALPAEIAASEFHVWSRNRTRAEELVSSLAPGTRAQVHDQPGAAAARADVVVTCTPSRNPLLSSADLRDGALVLAMGADSPGKRELSADVLAGATIVADDPLAVLRVGECAYLPQPVESAVWSDLGAILTGAKSVPRGVVPGEHAAGRVVFDSVGIAFIDTAVAALVVDEAEKRDLGRSFAFDPAGDPSN